MTPYSKFQIFNTCYSTYSNPCCAADCREFVNNKCSAPTGDIYWQVSKLSRRSETCFSL